MVERIDVDGASLIELVELCESVGASLSTAKIRVDTDAPYCAVFLEYQPSEEEGE